MKNICLELYLSDVTIDNEGCEIENITSEEKFCLSVKEIDEILGIKQFKEQLQFGFIKIVDILDHKFTFLAIRKWESEFHRRLKVRDSKKMEIEKFQGYY